MKNTLSMTGHEFIIPHEHENFTPIEQTEEPYMQNPKKDDTIVTRKSKRLEKVRDRGLQSLLVLTILCTLWMTHQRPLKRYISLLMLTYGRKQYRVRWNILCLMELGK